MRKYKNIEINTLPTTLGLSLNAFCQIFDLNYSLMRKAASGHQELGADQLSKWLKTRELVKHLTTVVTLEKMVVTLSKDEKYFEKKCEEHNFNHVKLKRECGLLEEKLRAVQQGIAVLKQMQVKGDRRAELVSELQLLELNKRLEQLSYDLDVLSFKMYATKCALWYFKERMQKAKAATSTPAQKETRIKKTGRISRSKSLQHKKIE